MCPVCKHRTDIHPQEAQSQMCCLDLRGVSTPHSASQNPAQSCDPSGEARGKGVCFPSLPWVSQATGNSPETGAPCSEAL